MQSECSGTRACTASRPATPPSSRAPSSRSPTRSSRRVASSPAPMSSPSPSRRRRTCRSRRTPSAICRPRLHGRMHSHACTGPMIDLARSAERVRQPGKLGDADQAPGQRHLRPDPTAALTRPNVVGVTGFEPATLFVPKHARGARLGLGEHDERPGKSRNIPLSAPRLSLR
jgi:hypothetical protein